MEHHTLLQATDTLLLEASQLGERCESLVQETESIKRMTYERQNALSNEQENLGRTISDVLITGALLESETQAVGVLQSALHVSKSKESACKKRLVKQVEERDEKFAKFISTAETVRTNLKARWSEF